MDDRRKAAAGKSGPIVLLKNLNFSKEKRSGGVTGTSSASAQSSASSNVEKESDRRPLHRFPLKPPDYAIAPEILMESFVDIPVLFLAVKVKIMLAIKEDSFVTILS